MENYMLAVVNCFRISIFAYHKQLILNFTHNRTVVNCFRISIFAYHKQLQSIGQRPHSVVNCFRISIFAYHKQLIEPLTANSLRCELLSN